MTNGGEPLLYLPVGLPGLVPDTKEVSLCLLPAHYPSTAPLEALPTSFRYRLM